MSTDVPLRCACGSVRGVATEIGPTRGTRLVCMCDDCQAYARWLDGPKPLLDAHGGTDIFQLTPSQLRVDHGAEHLRCVRLTSKGLLRWYTACCRTPFANTVASSKVPFAGVPHLIMDHASHGRPWDEVLGPVRARVHARFCRGAPPPDAHARAPVGLIVWALRKLAVGLVRRAHTPSPFFDAETGCPVTEPAVLTPTELERARA